jgi:hypothetical protein
VNLADHGVAGDADLGGDLTAGQTGNDKASELRDALRSPGFSSHGTASRTRRPDLGRRQGESRAQLAPRERQSPNARIRCPTAPMVAHGAALTEPHPRLRDCWPDVFQ